MTPKAAQVAARRALVEEFCTELGVDANAARLLVTGRRGYDTVPSREAALVRARVERLRRDIVETTVRPIDPITPPTRPRRA